MIYVEKVIRKMLKLDEHDRAIEKIKKNSDREVNEAIEVLKKSGQLERKVIRKTTTYIMAKAMGGIR